MCNRAVLSHGNILGPQSKSFSRDVAELISLHQEGPVQLSFSLVIYIHIVSDVGVLYSSP